MKWLYQHIKGKLSARFTLLTLGLLLLIQAASFVVVEKTVERFVNQEIEDAIEVSNRIWHNLLQQTHQRLEQGARVLAADFGFRSAVASRNEPTIASALKNSAERIDASVAILVDKDWNIKASSLDGSQAQANLVYVAEYLASRAGQTTNDHQIVLFNDQPTQFVAVAVRAPRVIGYVLMGFAIDRNQIQQANALTGIELALLARSEDGSANVLASHAGIEDFYRSAMRQEYFTNQYKFDANVEGETYVTRIMGQAVTGGYISVAYMKSFSAASTRFNELFNLYFLITLVGSVVFALLVTWLSRRIAFPLEALTQATQALQQGDYDVSLTGGQRSDEIGALARSFDMMRSSIKSQSDTISKLAYFDPLTSLPNRFSFRHLILELIQTQKFESFSVLTINLDRFKQVNDVLGYDMGDQILVGCARRLVSLNVTHKNYLARLAGDEFALLLPLDAEQATAVARQVLQAMQQPLEIEDTEIDVSVSVGIAAFPMHAENGDLLINASQIAMHSAKSRTHDIAVYRSDMVTATPESLSLLSQLRHALREDEFRIFLQPKIATQTQQVIAAEALIRWQHPTQGMIAPYKFIPFAEQAGFIRELTRWVITAVARDWHTLQTKEQLLRVSVNLSVRDLMDASFPDFLQRTLNEYQVPAVGLCLEITESAMMDDPTYAEQTLIRLASMGFRLSVDDFGTGYSSLGYLKRLPVNELKVDQSFVFGMMDNPNDYVIVQSTIELAHNLGLDVVAEGVETEAMLASLCKLGCEEAQGFFIGKPMPVASFLEWRQSWYSN